LPRARASKKKFYALVIPDTHIGYILDTPTYSVGAWDVTLQALNALRDRLTHVIILGDMGDFESVSNWASLRAEQVFVEEDFALVNARLDEISTISSLRDGDPLKVVYIEGNHEARLGFMEARYPALRDALNPKVRLRLAERGWTWVPQRHFYALGELHFAHGDIPGVKAPADMIRKKGVSTVYGHNHQHEVAHVHTLTGDRFAMSCGCLSSIDPPPPYMRGNVSEAWVHGFGLVQVRANGSFQVEFRQIFDESRTELGDGSELLASRSAVSLRLSQDRQIRADLRRRYADRYYVPGGQVVRTEPHHGKARVNKAGELIVSPTARTRRARIVRTLEDQE